MKVAHQLAPELYQAPVGEPGLLDASAGAPAGLDDDDVGAVGDQVAGGAETGQAGPDNHDVALHRRILAFRVLDEVPDAVAELRRLRRAGSSRAAWSRR